LLVPQSRKWTDGLSASEVDPLSVPVRAMLPSNRTAKLGPAEAGVKGRVEAHSRDGAALPSMLDVDLKGPLIAGAPLLDGTGTVVAILVRACKGASAAAGSQAPSDAMPWAAWAANQQDAAAKAPACTPMILGAPVSAIRSFLSATPAAAPAPAAWLGIRGEAVQEGAVRGVRVVAVAPSSPAEKGGLKPSADVIVAADGKPMDSPERLSELIAKHAPGDTVKFLVFGDGKFREMGIALRPAP
ncbi:MAG: PDZ domain-containing protein, partial [Myxococcales bacterium]|nr:PDZ domain-containing protein [Myxococcales bacterium]